jgi:AraC-like DNA-binding protein
MSVIYKPTNGDILTEVLGTVKLKGNLFCSTRFSAPWAISLPKSQFAHFHIIERGRGWITLANQLPVLVGSGDLVIIPHGLGHVLGDDPATPALPLEEIAARGIPLHNGLRYGGTGLETQIVCGSFHFENPTANPILALLPPLIHLRSSDGETHEWLGRTLRLLADEARHARQGSGTIITRLTDIIFVQAMRAWIEEQPEGKGGWLGALRDPQIGAALGLIHRSPARTWTVSSLAAQAGMSRSPFAARFTALVGEPPLSYLTYWRMQLAAELLSNERLTVSETAERIGYVSDAAFSRAFRRRFGESPGQYRSRKGAVLN